MFPIHPNRATKRIISSQFLLLQQIRHLAVIMPQNNAFGSHNSAKVCKAAMQATASQLSSLFLPL
nr:hypothetical protein [uncultured Cohaesibacter sp.]